MNDRYPGIDEDLTEMLANDVRKGFGMVVQVYWRPLCTFVQVLTNNKEAAEDITQETFMRAYTALRGYPRERIQAIMLKPWLYTIAKNESLTYLRREMRRRPAPELSLTSYETLHGAEAVVADSAEKVDTRETIREALASVSPQRRTSLLLYAEGFSQSDIAEMMGIDEGTVASHISRGRVQLRKAYHALTDDVDTASVG